MSRPARYQVRVVSFGYKITSGVMSSDIKELRPVWKSHVIILVIED